MSETCKQSQFASYVLHGLHVSTYEYPILNSELVYHDSCSSCNTISGCALERATKYFTSNLQLKNALN